MSFRSNRLLRYGGIALASALILFLIWDGSNGWGASEIFTGIGLILAVGAMLYLRQMDAVSEKNITQRIRAEYSSESQSQVFEIYKRLKTKELEYLFLKVLDDAHGNLNEVKKLASLAESMGPRAFLENHW